MSYECKNLSGTFCLKRNKECDPGAKGCVLEGKFSFPLKENPKKEKKRTNSSTNPKTSYKP